MTLVTTGDEAIIEQIRDVAPVVAEHVGVMPYPALNSAFDGLVPADNGSFQTYSGEQMAW